MTTGKVRRIVIDWGDGTEPLDTFFSGHVETHSPDDLLPEGKYRYDHAFDTVDQLHPFSWVTAKVQHADGDVETESKHILLKPRYQVTHYR